MTTKIFKIPTGEIKPLVTERGACFASDQITVEGLPVRFMYREDPDNESDSGWRFMSGFEDEAYISNANNLGIYDVNTIANYDPSIIPHLDAEIGSCFEKAKETERFESVTNWSPTD